MDDVKDSVNDAIVPVNENKSYQKTNNIKKIEDKNTNKIKKENK